MTDTTDKPSEPIVDNTLPVPPQAPEVPAGPPVYDPKLQPYAQWRQDEDKGARLAHDDAKVPPEDRATPDEVAAQGPAFLNGYNRHWTDLLDAGIIR